ncbi:hypothetical protein M422DRAFT_37487, partial [Sphaerobolus stellatus SS14]
MATYHSKLKLPNWTSLLRTTASFSLHASPRRRLYLAPGSPNILSLAKRYEPLYASSTHLPGCCWTWL